MLQLCVGQKVKAKKFPLQSLSDSIPLNPRTSPMQANCGLMFSRQVWSNLLCPRGDATEKQPMPGRGTARGRPSADGLSRCWPTLLPVLFGLLTFPTTAFEACFNCHSKPRCQPNSPASKALGLSRAALPFAPGLVLLHHSGSLHFLLLVVNIRPPSPRIHCFISLISVADKMPHPAPAE